jgi:LuxR family maltose regulon positive regulatory protein
MAKAFEQERRFERSSPAMSETGHLSMLQITPSERQTLQLLADEKPTSEIASCLGIAVSEVGSHLANLFARMGVATKTEAVSDALRRGLLMSRCAGEAELHRGAALIQGGAS